jgi:hypothetical protein
MEEDDVDPVRPHIDQATHGASEQEARRLGWSLVMAAAAGLCWTELGRAEEATVGFRASIVGLAKVSNDRGDAWTFPAILTARDMVSGMRQH